MYDKPNRIKYCFDLVAASTDATVTTEYAIRGPKGKKGTPWDWGIEGVTVALTSGASIAIGSTADADAYGDELDISAVAAEDAKSVRNTYWPELDSTTDTDVRDFVLGDIPADGKAVLTVIGSSAGAGTVFAIIDWQD
jgi:hypothetical protein